MAAAGSEPGPTTFNSASGTVFRMSPVCVGLGINALLLAHADVRILALLRQERFLATATIGSDRWECRTNDHMPLRRPPASRPPRRSHVRELSAKGGPRA